MGCVMLQKITLFINIVIALLYNIYFNSILIGHPDASLGFVFGLPFLAIVHIVILAVIGIFLEYKKKNKKAGRYFHSIIWVLIIGVIGFCTPFIFPSVY